MVMAMATARCASAGADDRSSGKSSICAIAGWSRATRRTGCVWGSRDLERRLFDRGRNGLNPNELRNVEYRIARLEQHVQHEVRDGNRNGWNGRNGYNGYNGYNGNSGYIDRDRDGRNDRYEDDGGRDHD